MSRSHWNHKIVLFVGNVREDRVAPGASFGSPRRCVRARRTAGDEGVRL
jgi:hypothetical protein